MHTNNASVAQEAIARSNPNADIVLDKNGNVLGWIRDGGCSHSACKRAMRCGRKYHAIPNTFGKTMSTYHFRTMREARAAIIDNVSWHYATF